MVEKIKAEEIYLKDLYGSRFLFEIPDFQRPFSWEVDNFNQLVGDIKDTLSINRESYSDEIEKFDPYFLGTVILWIQELRSDDSGKYAIIDGQQRLTSLAILMAVLRDITNDDSFKQTLQNKIFQKANVAEGTPECVRLKLREKEEDFFREYVLESGSTLKHRGINKKDLSQAKRNIIQAIETFNNAFLDEGSNIDFELVNSYIPYLLQKVALVYVRTNSLASGFRLFNVINTRGMSLNNADLLKSENLSNILDEGQRKRNTIIWENIEEEIGSEELEMVISFIRSIKLKERARQNIFEEFNKKIFIKEPDFKGERFVRFLNDIKGIYCEKIKDAKLNSGDTDKDTYYYNLVSLMRDFLPFNEWISAVIKFKEKYPDNELLYEFLIKLEKKITVEWVSGYSFTERLTRIFRVIKLIEETDDPRLLLEIPNFEKAVTNSRTYFENTLNDDNFYNKARTIMAKYILLRLDMEKQYNQNLKFSYSGIITVEHVLPRNPSDSYWLDKFDNANRLEWTNKLGNLALLNNRKNPQVGNKPFPEKVKLYFEKKSDFVLTQELNRYEDWSPKELIERHKRLCEEAIDIWIE